ncbi:transposase, partial [Streptomyces sp. WAC 01325]
MTTEASTEVSGHCRYSYRLRLSSAARAALEVEWGRVRCVWNECVAKSRAVHTHNRAAGEGAACGPVQLAAMLTEARARTGWLREGACGPQQQVIRDFGKSRARALKDMKAG